MQVVRFTDEYALVAPLLGLSESELRMRDAVGDSPQPRWFAFEHGKIVGLAQARTRPDDRTFLTLRGSSAESHRQLTEVAHKTLRGPVRVMCHDEEQLALFQSIGFKIEVTGHRFEVAFGAILPRLQRAWVPTRYTVRSITEVDADRAFELDNKVRSLVPGMDGWRGNRGWFDDEMRSPEFDATAYLIGVHRDTDECVGLVRIWRNPDGPRLGLIGVLPDHRGPGLAVAMLKQALTAASRWGYDSVRTETSPQNRRTYPIFMRLGLQRTGEFRQLLLP